jgi:Tol biopolymer transport system component
VKFTESPLVCQFRSIPRIAVPSLISPAAGEPAVKIGEVQRPGLSPDGKWALSIASQTSAPQLILYPSGAGEPRRLERQGINYQIASFFPDGNRILIAGNEPGHAMRLYVQDLAGGKAQPLTPEGISDLRIPVSPDARWAACRNPEGKLVLYPVQGGEPREVSGLDPEDSPTQ